MDYDASIIVDDSDEDVMSANAGLGLAVSDNDDSKLSDAPSDLMEVDETFETARFSSRSHVNVLQPRRRHAGLSRGFIETEEVISEHEDNVMDDKFRGEKSDFEETDINSVPGTGAGTSVKLGRSRTATIEALSNEVC